MSVASDQLADSWRAMAAGMRSGQLTGGSLRQAADMLELAASMLCGPAPGMAVQTALGNRVASEPTSELFDIIQGAVAGYEAEDVTIVLAECLGLAIAYISEDLSRADAAVDGLPRALREITRGYWERTRAMRADAAGGHGVGHG